jgi:hypothetical protein
MLDPQEDCQITWWISWSPCSECVDKVARFLATHCNVSLTIFSTRLYYFWDSAYQSALHTLYHERAQVKVMSFQEFEDFWEKFCTTRESHSGHGKDYLEILGSKQMNLRRALGEGLLVPGHLSLPLLPTLPWPPLLRLEPSLPGLLLPAPALCYCPHCLPCPPCLHAASSRQAPSSFQHIFPSFPRSTFPQPRSPPTWFHQLQCGNRVLLLS